MNFEIKKAMNMASLAHDGQYRKGNKKLPYIVHPFEVYDICSEMKRQYENDNVRIAAILHDTLEDTNLKYQEIYFEFGEQIANLVLDNTENKKLSWEERKEHTINNFKNKSLDSKKICIADKLSNIKSLYCDFIEIGEDMWNNFNRGYDKQKWYYEELLNQFKNVSDLKVWINQYEDIYDKLFVKGDI